MLFLRMMLSIGFTIVVSLLSQFDDLQLWLNWSQIAVMRKLLKRGNFLSQADLKTRIFEFIDYFNRTMAKPFKWTYQGKPLTV